MTSIKEELLAESESANSDGLCLWGLSCHDMGELKRKNVLALELGTCLSMLFLCYHQRRHHSLYFLCCIAGRQKIGSVYQI